MFEGDGYVDGYLTLPHLVPASGWGGGGGTLNNNKKCKIITNNNR